MRHMVLVTPYRLDGFSYAISPRRRGVPSATGRRNALKKHVSKGHKPQEAHHRPEHRSRKLGVAIPNFTRCSRKERHLGQVTSNTVQSERTRPYRSKGTKGAGRQKTSSIKLIIIYGMIV